MRSLIPALLLAATGLAQAQDASLLARRSIITSSKSEEVVASGIEYRRTINRNIEWSSTRELNVRRGVQS